MPHTHACCMRASLRSCVHLSPTPAPSPGCSAPTRTHLMLPAFSASARPFAHSAMSQGGMPGGVAPSCASLQRGGGGGQGRHGMQGQLLEPAAHGMRWAACMEPGVHHPIRIGSMMEPAVGGRAAAARSHGGLSSGTAQPWHGPQEGWHRMGQRRCSDRVTIRMHPPRPRPGHAPVPPRCRPAPCDAVLGGARLPVLAQAHHVQVELAAVPAPTHACMHACTRIHTRVLG